MNINREKMKNPIKETRRIRPLTSFSLSDKKEGDDQRNGNGRKA
jgi:hypothetical protein